MVQIAVLSGNLATRRDAVTLSPAASQWLSGSDERDQLAQITGLPVRDSARLRHEWCPHPDLTWCVVAPATANSVAKLALGIADNQALATAIEAIDDPVYP